MRPGCPMAWATVCVAVRRACALWLGSDAVPRRHTGEGQSMPLEPDDLRISPEQEKLNRQLEALQRYVSGLQQHEHANSAAQPPPGSSRGGPPGAGCCSPACWSPLRWSAGSSSARSPGPMTDRPAPRWAPTRRPQHRAPMSPRDRGLRHHHASPRWPRRRARRRSTGPTRCSPSPSSCGGAGRVQPDHE